MPKGPSLWFFCAKRIVPLSFHNSVICGILYVKLRAGRNRKGEKMDIISIIADEIGAKNTQVEAAVKLIDEGEHDPLYRKIQEGSDRKP